MPDFAGIFGNFCIEFVHARGEFCDHLGIGFRDLALFSQVGEQIKIAAFEGKPGPFVAPGRMSILESVDAISSNGFAKISHESMFWAIVVSMRLLAIGTLILILGMVSPAECGDDSQETEIRSAVEKAILLLVSASRVSGEQRKCFTCHSQGLPVLTIVDAGAYGFEIDGDGIEQAVEHTLAHLKRGQSNYLKGIGQGGKADTAGMALWALDAAGHKGDEITNAVVDFLLQWNESTPYWSAQTQRPPSEGSRFTSTFLALRGLDAYAYEDKQEAIEKRRMSARRWLITTRPETTEDHVFRLWGLAISRAGEAKIAEAGSDLIALQRKGGGWAQLAEGKSDAYATGSALVALLETGQVDAGAESYQKGVKYLLESQLKDGSWHVATRSNPIQKFYDSGFPHGTDQFISCSASSWATWALLKALPRN